VWCVMYTRIIFNGDDGYSYYIYITYIKMQLSHNNNIFISLSQTLTHTHTHKYDESLLLFTRFGITVDSLI